MENKEWDETKKSHDDGEDYGHGQGEENGQLSGQYQDKFNPSSNEAIVKGLSFKAEGEDVREFFSQYGEITSVNVERRFNGDSKGSCFIKFATSEGLNNAVAATGVEFLGRQVWVAKTKPKSERVKEFGPRRGTFRGNRAANYGGYNNDGGYGGQSNNHNNNYDNGYQNNDNGYTRGAGRGRGRGGRGNTRGRGGAPRRVEKVDQSKILFVGNLNYKTERDEIWDFFETIGKVVDVRIAKNQSGSVSYLSWLFIDLSRRKDSLMLSLRPSKMLRQLFP